MQKFSLYYSYARLFGGTTKGENFLQIQVHMTLDFGLDNKPLFWKIMKSNILVVHFQSNKYLLSYEKRKELTIPHEY